MVTTGYSDSGATKDIVEKRFDEVKTYAEESLDYVSEYMDQLTVLLSSLVVTDTDDIEDIGFPSWTALDYGAIPSFSEVLGEFPSFAGMLPEDPTMEDIPEVSASGLPTKNFNFISNIPSAPTTSFGPAPAEPTLTSITLPPAPTLDFPDAPSITNVSVPSAPTISLPGFTATAPPLTMPGEPTGFSFTEAPYNSDIRLPLFNKILTDIANGGTGLDVDVEADIYDRFLARQQAENDRLYQEVQNQFSATGFGLPSGAFASRLLQVSSEISLKNDQASREITINQAELAQKNTQFTTEQAGLLEKMLVDFHNSQQERALKAEEILARNAIEIYNSIITMHNLRLEQYKTEAQVFESKIKAEMAAIEIYKAEVEATKASVDVQNARVSLYNAQLGGVEIMQKIYMTEMESAKIQAEMQSLQIEIFKTQTEVYATSISAEKTKVDAYASEVGAEGVRADAFKSEVQAYEAEVKGKLGVVDAQRMQAESKLAENRNKIEKYRADLERYNSEINSEVKTADLAVKGYQSNVAAFQAQTGAKEMEFRAMIAETSGKIDVARAQMEKAKAMLEATTNSYVAIKDLQVKGTEGIMNVNAQLASSAMNAVNASAGLSDGFSGSMGVSHSHSYKYEMD